jgi:peptidoglycan/xylan/chitin deacetylase (PgdA/CDA1 family)
MVRMMANRAMSGRALLPRDARSIARKAAVAGLSRLSPDGLRADRLLAEPRVHVVALHHVFADEEASFRALLADLARTHRFVGYSEAVDRVASGDIGAPYLAFTFDDGLKNCLRVASVLEEFDARASFFVCPGIVGETRLEVVDAFCRDRLHTPPLDFMDWDDLEQLLGRGHEIGGHTVGHHDLSGLPPERLHEEIGGSFDALKARLGTAEHFAWPYGRFATFSPEAAECVFDAGYRSCASAVHGCHVDDGSGGEAEPCLRRQNVEALWPLRHTRYLLARSARLGRVGGSSWPEGWRGGAARGTGRVDVTVSPSD